MKYVSSKGFVNIKVLNYFYELIAKKEEFSQYSSVDPFMQNLIRNIDQTLVLYKTNLSVKNQDILVGQLAVEITTSLEKNIYKCMFSRVSELSYLH